MMNKKATVFFLMVLLFFGEISGFDQEEESKRAKKIRDLIGVLETRSWDRAVEELVKIGEPAVEPLLEELKRHTRFTSARSCHALTRIGTKDAVDAVMEALKNPQSPAMVREYAALALGDVKSEASLSLLSETLTKDAATLVRRYAAKSLGKIGSEKAIDALLAALEDSSGVVRGTAAEELGNFKSPRSVASLIELLEDDSDFARQRLRPALVKIGEPAVDPLLETLDHEDGLVRWMAVWILGNIQSEQAVKGLLKILKDPDWMVREEAAVALARINARKSGQPLIELLEDEENTGREAAAWILGKMKADQAVKPLIQILADEQSGWMAATALGEIQSLGALAPLISALGSDDLNLRRASVWALGKIPSVETVEPLLRVLVDDDWEVRMWAVLALEKIGTPQALEAIKTIKYDEH